MNQIPNIEETHNIREVEEIVDKKLKQISNYIFSRSISLQDSAKYERQVWIDTLHHQLQKAREEERERIEAIFKEHVPPHAMDLEDGVWLKRLLNKAFNHDKNV